ncbi:MAG: SusC/RagA family TonB-linked outer membrane protein [Marinifilaceae bacterium]
MRQLRQARSYAQMMLFVCAMMGFQVGSAEASSTKGTTNALPQAAQTVIKGRVVDATSKEPIPGATILIKGTTIGVVTDIDGNYTISVPNAKETTLVFTVVGMLKQEILVGDKTEIIVGMKEDQKELDEVVIVGYQSVHRRNVTGSVTRVKADALQDIPAASITEMLSGKVTGLQAMSSGGAPGSKSSLVIRGNTVMSGSLSEVNEFSDPLYVIDGIPTTLQDIAGYDATNTDYLASLNPEDVESIDILKDASAAAIYGSRGANGVIIIKTKGGRAGKTEISVKASYGITVKPELKKTPVGMAERRIKMDLINKWWPYATHADGSAGDAIMALTDSLNPAFNNNIDYQGLFYRTGHVQNYDVALSGGTESANYRLSLGYYNEKGIIVANGYNRYTMNLNMSVQPFKPFRNNTVLRFAYGDRQTGQGSGNVHNVFPVKPQDMNSSLFEVTDEQYAQISGKLDDLYNTNRNLDVSISNLANLDLYKGVTLNSQIGLVYGTNRKNYFQPSSVRDDENGYAYHYSSQRMSANIETYLSYTGDVAKNHNINFLLGNTFDFSQMEDSFADATGGSGDMIHTLQGYSKDDINASTGVSMNAMVSFWARLGYRFMDRYLVEANFRRDASSRFGADSRWGNFPAVSAGWIFSDEAFMKRTSSWLDYGKVKASWGRNGKQFSDDYLRYNMYTLKAGSLSNYPGSLEPGSYNGVQAVLPDFSKLADRGLSWEESTQWDLGLELEMFKRRFHVTFDAYNRETDALLFDVAFPAYTGFNQVKANVAGIMNYGVELAFDAYLFDRASSHQIEIQAGVTHNNNKVTKLPNGNRDYYAGNNYGYSVGRPGPIFYGLNYVGPVDNVNNLPVNPYTGKPLDPTMEGIWGSVYPGYPLYDDISGDYVVSDKLDQDQAFIVKNANPKAMGHLNFVFTYKGWKLRANSQFAFGRDVYDQVSEGILNRYGRGTDWINKGMINPSDYDFWTHEGCGAYYPALVPSGVTGMKTAYPFRGGTTMWWENGNYWKINDITLSYNINERALSKVGLKRIYVYATAYNVWQWQKSKTVMDVSTVDAMGRTLGDGYPLPRKYVLGINVHF